MHARVVSALDDVAQTLASALHPPRPHFVRPLELTIGDLQQIFVLGDGECLGFRLAGAYAGFVLDLGEDGAGLLGFDL